MRTKMIPGEDENHRSDQQHDPGDQIDGHHAEGGQDQRKPGQRHHRKAKPIKHANNGRRNEPVPLQQFGKIHHGTLSALKSGAGGKVT